MTTYPVLIDHDVAAVMSDGTVLRSTIYRPAAGEGEAFPALLTRTPYGRDQAINPTYLNPPALAARGFVVVLQDCRGRFASEGTFIPSVHEESDGAETVEWVASLPYCNGKVGMWGRSYFAETQWRAAQRRPAALKALALGVSAGDNANNGALYRGGAHEWGSRLNWGHASASLHELTRAHAHDPKTLTRQLEAWRRLDAAFADGSVFDTLPLRNLEGRMGEFMATHILPSAGEGPGSPFTQLWDSASAEPVEIPTLHIGGWFDIFALNTLTQYTRQLQASRTTPGITPRLIMGPWSHTNLTGTFPGHSFGMGASAAAVGDHGDLSTLHAQWFDAVLNDHPAALEAVPPVLLYFMGENRWRGFDELPAPTETVSWYLGPSGQLTTEQPAGHTVAAYVYDPLDPVPTVGGPTMLYGADFPGPADQHDVEDRKDVLVFTSEALEEPLTIYGDIAATLFVSSTAPDTDFVVRLCRLTPDGTSLSLADGITRGSWREACAGDGLFNPDVPPSAPLEPGRTYQIDVSLWATACTFAPGDRIRVQVTSSCHPRWDRNLNTGQLAYDSADTQTAHQSIHCGAATASHLRLGILENTSPQPSVTQEEQPAGAVGR